LTFRCELTIDPAEAHHINVLLAEYYSSVCCSHHLTAELTRVCADVTGVGVADLVQATIEGAAVVSVAEVLNCEVVLLGEVGILIVRVVYYLVRNELPFI
jgi:hypothetical protein